MNVDWLIYGGCVISLGLSAYSIRTSRKARRTLDEINKVEAQTHNAPRQGDAA
jgi:hypothetical protein